MAIEHGLSADDYVAAIPRYIEGDRTDGWPIILPTTEGIGAMLRSAPRPAEEPVGRFAARSEPITVRDVAEVAWMAGCLPAYMPVVLAAFELLLDPALESESMAASADSPVIGGGRCHSRRRIQGHHPHRRGPSRRCGPGTHWRRSARRAGLRPRRHWCGVPASPSAAHRAPRAPQADGCPTKVVVVSRRTWLNHPPGAPVLGTRCGSSAALRVLTCL
jgi:hypothetical protein